MISSETTKEEMIYTNKKEMIKEELDQLENKKQLYWVGFIEGVSLVGEITEFIKSNTRRSSRNRGNNSNCR